MTDLKRNDVNKVQRASYASSEYVQESGLL